VEKFSSSCRKGEGERPKEPFSCEEMAIPYFYWRGGEGGHIRGWALGGEREKDQVRNLFTLPEKQGSSHFRKQRGGEHGASAGENGVSPLEIGGVVLIFSAVQSLRVE